KDWKIGEKTIQILLTKQKQEERKEKVYNLLVDDCHEYFANDVLVHNCIAYLLACYFVYFGKNFNLYDVDHSTFLNKVSSSGKIVEPEYKQQQDELAERIRDIKRMLSTTSNRLVTDSLTRELRNLEAQIDTDIVDIQPTTVEQMRTN